MDQEALKKSVYLNLRCVTQSCKGGVPFERLEKDYKDLIGKPIPINDLGYNSVELFLRSIPDVVRLKRNKGHLFVEGVADASTAHIASLISRQKNSKTAEGTSKKPSLQIRKYSCHESWRSFVTKSAGIFKKDNKASISHPVTLKMPALNTSNTELVNSAPKTVNTDTKSLTGQLSLINSSQKVPDIQQGTSLPSTSKLAEKGTTEVFNETFVLQSSSSAIEKTLIKKHRRQQRKKMKKAAQALIKELGVSFNNTQLHEKVLKAQNLGMTTEEFLEKLKGFINSSTVILEQDSVKNSKPEIPSTSPGTTYPGTSLPSTSVLADKETTEVFNETFVPQSSSSAIEKALIKTQRRQQRRKMKKAAQAFLKKFGVSLNHTQLHEKVLKAQNLGMTTEEFLEKLKGFINSLTVILEQVSVNNSKPEIPSTSPGTSLPSTSVLAEELQRRKMQKAAQAFLNKFGVSLNHTQLHEKVLKAQKSGMTTEEFLEKLKGFINSSTVILEQDSVKHSKPEIPSTSDESLNCASQSGWETSSNSSSNASKILPKPDLNISNEHSLQSVQSVLPPCATISSIPQSPVVKAEPVLPYFAKTTPLESGSSSTLPKLSSSTLKENQDPVKNSEQLTEEMQKLKSLTLRNLWNLICHFRDGLHMCFLSRQYMDFYGTLIPYKDLGYLTLKDFIVDNPDVICLKM